MATSTNVQPGKEVLEGEVSAEILQQFESLKSALKNNQELAQQFALNNDAEEFQRMDFEIAKVNQLVKQLRSTVRRERLKNHVLSEQVARDGQMAEQVNRRYEMLTKNPQYGRAQSIEYMHTIVLEHEKLLNNNEATIAKVEDMLRNLMDPEKQSENVTEQDLSNHIRRFDEIFSVVATQIYGVNEEVEKIKDSFLEQQRKLYGRFARNPFDKQKRNEQLDAFRNLKGLDAFPSQHAVLSISEFLPRQAVQSTVGPVGMGGGAFTSGAPGSTGWFSGGFNKPATSAASSFAFSSFNQPGAGATSTASTFSKPFSLNIGTSSAATTGSGLGGTSIFGTPKTTATTAAPSLGGGLFGTPAAAATTTAAPAFNAFGVSNSSAAPATPAFGFGSSTPASSGAGANLNLTSGVFGAAAATSTPKQPAFGFGGTSGALAAAPGSIFGNTGTQSAQQQPTASTTNFGSTLSSAASGTLFRGSASAAPTAAFGSATPSSTGTFGGAAKSLFGAK